LSGHQFMGVTVVAGVMRVPRTRGLLSGLLLVLLGAWGALIAFIGPYFNYAYTPDSTWTYNSGRLWMEILPGAGALLGGLIVLGSAHRAIASFGGWLAAICGAWFVVGLPLSQLSGMPNVGSPTGGTTRQVIETLGFFTGLGAVIIFLAALALGRFAVVGVRESQAADRAAAQERLSTVDRTGADQTDADRVRTDQSDADRVGADRTEAGSRTGGIGAGTAAAGAGVAGAGAGLIAAESAHRTKPADATTATGDSAPTQSAGTRQPAAQEPVTRQDAVAEPAAARPAATQEPVPAQPAVSQQPVAEEVRQPVSNHNPETTPVAPQPEPAANEPRQRSVMEPAPAAPQPATTGPAATDESTTAGLNAAQSTTTGSLPSGPDGAGTSRQQPDRVPEQRPVHDPYTTWPAESAAQPAPAAQPEQARPAVQPEPAPQAPPAARPGPMPAAQSQSEFYPVDQAVPDQPASTGAASGDTPRYDGSWSPSERGNATTDQPATAQPRSEGPMTNQPMTNQPMSNQPMSSQPMTGQPRSDQPMADQPRSDVPMTNQPMSNQPMGSQPTVNQSANRPATDQPTTGLPAAPPITEGNAANGGGDTDEEQSGLLHRLTHRRHAAHSSGTPHDGSA
jgi:hypothetical protein